MSEHTPRGTKPRRPGDSERLKPRDVKITRNPDTGRYLVAYFCPEGHQIGHLHLGPNAFDGRWPSMTWLYIDTYGAEDASACGLCWRPIRINRPGGPDAPVFKESIFHGKMQPGEVSIAQRQAKWILSLAGLSKQVKGY